MPQSDANNLLFSDDFTSYSSEADIEAAYPGAYGGDGYDLNATDWCSTCGPDGGYGLRDQAVAPARDTGAITKYFLNPQGRWFRVLGRWDFAALNAVLSAHSFLTISFQQNSPFYSLNTITLARVHASGNLRVTVETDAPYGNLNGGKTKFQEIGGVLMAGAKNVEVWGRFSVVSGSGPTLVGSTDGEVHVLVGGTEVFSFTGPVWRSLARDGGAVTGAWPLPMFNTVDIATIGRYTNTAVYDETAGGGGSQVGTDYGGLNQSTECCAGNVSPGESTAGEIDVEDDVPLQPWTRACTGMGLVPIVANPVDPEFWDANGARNA